MDYSALDTDSPTYSRASGSKYASQTDRRVNR